MKRVLLIPLLLISVIGFSQPSPARLIQSPNAAGLGIYGKIDVSPFTGLANINIPVFSLKEGDIDVSCKLQYFSGGVKPEQHPGWVGQNWSLSVGGQVSRKKNAAIDEVAISIFNPDHLSSYYYNYNYLNDNNWYTNSFMENSINPNNPQSFTTLEPDEFMFSLPNGTSGSFFLNHLGVWQVKCKSAAGLKVAVSLNPQPYVLTNANNPQRSITIHRLIYSIIITDQFGYKYTFGNNPVSIEFVRTEPKTVGDSYNSNVEATTWSLTKIESPLGNVVTYKYVRKENQYHLNAAYPYKNNGWITVPNCSGTINQSGPHKFSGAIINPCLLYQIEASSFKVDFLASESGELKYDFVSANYAFIEFEDQGDLDDAHPGHPNTPEYIRDLVKYYKLNDIVISDHNNVVTEKYNFQYSASSSQRLFLSSFRRKATNSLTQESPYIFTYDNTALPPYNSFKIDKWGYYNNKLFPLSSPPATEALANPFFDMDEQYTKAGILTQIKYPTGGYTTFIYEPNSYSSLLKKNGNSIDLIVQSGIGGGLRIKQVTSFDNIGNQIWKKYVYTPLATPTVSSGILAGISRIYVTQQVGSNPIYGGSEYFNYIDKRALNYTDGKEVVYSEVKEELQDGSYTVHKFSNSDNPAYRDQPPFNIATWVHLFDGYGSSTQLSSNTNPYMTHISRDLERGNLLSQEFYNASGIKVKKIENVYNTNPARFDQFVRSIVKYNYGYSCGELQAFANEIYLQAIKTYTYYPYLEKQSEYYYEPSGQQFVKTETNFTYDPQTFQLIKKSTTSSKNELFEVVYKYPKDYPATSVYTGLISQNRIGTPIETLEYTSTVFLNSKFNNYGFWNSNTLIASVNTQTTIGNNPVEVKISYNNYDSKGNLREIQKANDVKEVYLYGYKNQQVVARVIGSTYATVASFVNQSVLDNPNTEAAMITELNKIRSGLASTKALVTTYTYAPLIGMTTETDPNGFIRRYVYDGFNRLILITDKDNRINKKICYNYAGQLENCTIVCAPNWQNTGEFRCVVGPCGNNTGYQEQKQIDINPCSPTYNQPYWVPVGYNPGACPISNCVNLTSTNVAGWTGYTASYFSNTTGLTYNFSVSTASGLQPLGTVPAGSYTLTISRTSGYPMEAIFKSGCKFQVITGTSAVFYNVNVSATTCNSITIDIIEQ